MEKLLDFVCELFITPNRRSCVVVSKVYDTSGALEQSEPRKLEQTRLVAVTVVAAAGHRGSQGCPRGHPSHFLL